MTMLAFHLVFLASVLIQGNCDTRPIQLKLPQQHPGSCQRSQWATPIPNLVTVMEGFDPHRSDPFSKRNPGIKQQIFEPFKTSSNEHSVINSFVSKAREEINCFPNFQTNTVFSYAQYEENFKGYEFAFKEDVPAGIMRDVTQHEQKVRSFFQETAGEIMISAIECITHSVAISHFVELVFTEGFKSAIRELYMAAEAPDSEVSNSVAKNFFSDFGSHFIREAKLGSKMWFVVALKKRSANVADQRQREKCTEQLAHNRLAAILKDALTWENHLPSIDRRCLDTINYLDIISIGALPTLNVTITHPVIVSATVEKMSTLFRKQRISSFSQMNDNTFNAAKVADFLENKTLLYCEVMTGRECEVTDNSINWTGNQPTFSPVIEADSPVIRTSYAASRLIRTDEVASPIIRTDEVASPIIRTNEAASPLIRTNEAASPLIRTDEVASPIIRTNEDYSPLIGANEAASPVIRTDEAARPLIRTDEAASPVTGTNNAVKGCSSTHNCSDREICHDDPSMELRYTCSPRYGPVIISGGHDAIARQSEVEVLPVGLNASIHQYLLEELGSLRIFNLPFTVEHHSLTAVGERLYNCLGTQCYYLDILDRTHRWSVFVTLPISLSGGHTAVAVGTHIWFAQHKKLYDLDTITRAISTHNLPMAMTTEHSAVSNATHSYLIGVGAGYAQIWVNTEANSGVKWHHVATMSKGRRYHACMWLGDKVYITGGTSMRKDVEVFDTRTRRVHMTGQLTVGRQDHEMMVLDGAAAVVGGHVCDSSKYTDTIEVYDDVSGTWLVSRRKLQKRNYRFGLAQLHIRENY